MKATPYGPVRYPPLFANKYPRVDTNIIPYVKALSFLLLMYIIEFLGLPN